MAIKVTDATYENFIEDGVTLVDFWAPWCRPCLALGPLIEELSNERTDVKIGKMNADENPEIMKKLGIRSIPTIIVYKNGMVVERQTGVLPKDKISELIDKHLN